MRQINNKNNNTMKPILLLPLLALTALLSACGTDDDYQATYPTLDHITPAHVLANGGSVLSSVSLNQNESAGQDSNLKINHRYFVDGFGSISQSGIGFTYKAEATGYVVARLHTDNPMSLILSANGNDVKASSQETGSTDQILVFKAEEGETYSLGINVYLTEEEKTQSFNNIITEKLNGNNSAYLTIAQLNRQTLGLKPDERLLHLSGSTLEKDSDTVNCNLNHHLPSSFVNFGLIINARFGYVRELALPALETANKDFYRRDGTYIVELDEKRETEETGAYYEEILELLEFELTEDGKLANAEWSYSEGRWDNSEKEDAGKQSFCKDIFKLQGSVIF